MGGCATKPKVLKAEPKPLEAEVEVEAEAEKPSLVQETEDDDNTPNKRHSLSSLFHQNQNEQAAKINDDATTRDASSESKTKEIIIKQESLPSQEVDIQEEEEESEKIKGVVVVDVENGDQIQNNEEKTQPEEEKLEAENVSEEKESHQNIQNQVEQETTVADVAVVEKVIQVVESELEQKSQSIEVEAKSVNDVREGP